VIGGEADVHFVDDTVEEVILDSLAEIMVRHVVALRVDQ